MNDKPALHAKLTEEAYGLLKILAHGRGINVTSLLEALAREEARRKRVRYDPTHPAITAAKKEKRA